MLKKLLTAITISAFAAAANATIIANLVDLGAPLGEGTYTFDVVVTLTDGPEPDDPDDWTLASMTATLDGGAVFINNDPQNPPLMPTGDLVYDSFFTTPRWFPNTIYHGYFPLAGTLIEVDQLRSGAWYDLADTGNGDFVINRLSVQGDGAAALLSIDLYVGAANTGDELFPFNFVVPVPEPGSMLLLGIGVLGLCRRL